MAELWLVKGCDSGFFSCEEIDYIERNGVLMSALDMPEIMSYI